MLTPPRFVLGFSQIVTAASLLLALTGCSSEEGKDPDENVEVDIKLGPTTGQRSGCSFDVSAGDHTFSCDGVTFLVMVSERCMSEACGLIADVHGGTMSGLQMRDNTKLHELAPEKGFIVVHPSQTPNNTGGAWSGSVAQYEVVANFLEDLIQGYRVDTDRVHFTGFSQGGIMTWWFLCNRPQLLASAAPVASAGLSDSSCLNDSWPRIPLLVMNGVKDLVSTVDAARAQIESITAALALTGGDEVEGGGNYDRKRWTGERGMQLDYIEHDYGGQAVLDGHCLPGGSDVEGAPNNFGLNATTCTTGEIDMHWGELVLQWFIDHPKRR